MHVGDRGAYIGNGLQAIDAKGRVGLPGDLRAQIEANSGERKLYIDLHDKEDCLVAFDHGFVKQRLEQINSDEAHARAIGQAFDRAFALSNAFASAEPLPFDASGRFIVPPNFRDDFSSFAFFVGALDYIEIWNPATMLASPRASSKAKRLVEWHLKQRGLA